MKKYLEEIKNKQYELEQKFEDAFEIFEDKLFEELEKLTNLKFTMYGTGEDYGGDPVRIYWAKGKIGEQTYVFVKYNLRRKNLQFGSGNYEYEKIINKWIEEI